MRKINPALRKLLFVVGDSLTCNAAGIQPIKKQNKTGSCEKKLLKVSYEEVISEQQQGFMPRNSSTDVMFA